MTPPVLVVRDLEVRLPGRASHVRAVDGVSFEMAPGERVGIVGESGAGKSLTTLALLGLLPRGVSTGAGSSVRIAGGEVVGASETELRRVRGGRVGMVFQDPSSTMTPVRTVGDQLLEVLRQHRDLSGDAARSEAIDLLRSVGLSDPVRTFDDPPHRLSGGMRQRACIALALAGEPDLLVADEATASLDVTVQAQILDLLVHLSITRDVGILMISHDLAVVAETCQRLLVMRAGVVVEAGPVERVLHEPAHPYTRSLLAARPRLEGAIPSRGLDPEAVVGGEPGSVDRSLGEVVLRFDDVGVTYRSGARAAPKEAVRGASLSVYRGDVLGLVGESGSGKSSLVRAAVGVVPLSSGRVWSEGHDIAERRRTDPLGAARCVQLVFQDAAGALDPRQRIGAAIEEVLRLHGSQEPQVDRRVDELLDAVQLERDLRNRFPHELSGGQRQRLGIARGLAVEPQVLILDEPVSALDVSVQARILALLESLRSDLDLTIVLIAHDLAVVRNVCNRVAVMFQGGIVEQGATGRVFDQPSHAHTVDLLSSVPRIERRRGVD